MVTANTRALGYAQAWPVYPQLSSMFSAYQDDGFGDLLYVGGTSWPTGVAAEYCEEGIDFDLPN